jgi:hypothetical protein
MLQEGMHRLARLAGFGVIATPRAPFRLDRVEGGAAPFSERSLERTPAEARGHDPKR